MRQLSLSLLFFPTVVFLVLGFATLEAQLTPPTDDLILHLKSDAGVVKDANGRLVVWEDQADGDNNATPAFGTSEPQFSCDTFPNGEHGVLGFQGDTGLGIDNPLDLSVTELSVYAVMGLSPSGGTIFGNYSNAINWGFGYNCTFADLPVPFFFTSNGTEETYGNDPVSSPIPAANPGDKHYVSWHASNTALTKQVYVDGVVTTINFTESSSPDYQALGYHVDEHEVPYIGSFREFGGHHTGPIAEILVYGSVSTAQREAVEDYLQEKYGFPGQPAAMPPALPDLPPTLLTCTSNLVPPFSVELAWNGCGTYTQQRVLRDGDEVAILSGTATSYSDISPLVDIDGLHSYQVEATIAGSPELSEVCESNFQLPTPQGRILHLAADQGVTTDVDGVLTWEDQSPAGGENDAQREPAFGSGFAQEICEQLPNGFHSVIQFEDPVGAGDLTGAGMSFLQPEELAPETRSMSVYAVIEVTAGLSSSIFSNYSNARQWGYGFVLWLNTSGNQVCFFTSAGTPATIHDFCSPVEEALSDGWHLITTTVDFASGTKRVYIDGVLSEFWDFDQDPTSDECTDGDGTGDKCYVGNSMGFDGIPAPNPTPAIGSWASYRAKKSHRYHNGGLAELVMYDSVSEDQRLMVEAELMAKYFDGVAPLTCDAGGGAQIAGDCNQDGTLDLSDVVCLLGHLFQGFPDELPCSTDLANLGLMDGNGDGGIDLSDAIYKLAFLFQGGPSPGQGQDCTSIFECPQNPGCP